MTTRLVRRAQNPHLSLLTLSAHSAFVVVVVVVVVEVSVRSMGGVLRERT